jgi:hypothetical protein
MQPTQREAWAKTWAALIAPGGQLVTMMFPVDSERKGGPPFAVTPELYEQLLVPTGIPPSPVAALHPYPSLLWHSIR